MSPELICPCGRIIKDASEFKLLYLKKELNEIDILCPNDNCYLREVGYIKFEIVDGKPKFKEASFYPPFVTWNASQMGREAALAELKNTLKKLVERIDWSMIKPVEAKT
ncbi:MAG: hypothetical protein HA496_07225 [Thaumarchaeota archaeon]|jgi:hypothetical protein|nr:hypothetical protein [Nitrososphaerota archaeon]